MNQIIVNYTDNAVKPIRVTWSLKTEDGVELIDDPSVYESDIEVFTIPYDLRLHSKLFATVTRYFDDGNGGETIPDVVGPIAVLNPGSGLYDNVRVNDPIYPPGVETSVEIDNLKIELKSLKTLYNVSSIDNVNIVIMDETDEVVFTVFDMVVPDDGTILIPLTDIDVVSPIGDFYVRVMYLNDLNEGSKFNSSKITIGDDRIMITSKRHNISTVISNTITFNNTTGLQLDTVTLNDSNDNIVDNLVIVDGNKLTIPKNIMVVDSEYYIVFNTPTESISIDIRTIDIDSIYTKYPYSYEYATTPVESLTDMVPGFAIDSLVNNVTVYHSKNMYDDLIDTSVYEDINTYTNDMVGVINKVSSGDLTGIDDMFTISEQIDSILQSNMLMHEEYYNILIEFNRNSGIYSEQVKTLVLNSDQSTKVINTIAHLKNARDIMTNLIYKFALGPIYSVEETTGYVFVPKIKDSSFSSVCIRNDLILLDYITDVGREFMLVNVDPMTLNANIVNRTVVPNSICDETDGVNSLVYSQADGLIYFNNIVDNNGVKTTVLTSYNPASRIFQPMPVRPANESGDIIDYTHNTLSYLGNGLILSTGGISTDYVTSKVVYIFDTVTKSWDNITTIDDAFINIPLVNVQLINGDVIFVRKSRSSNTCMVFKLDTRTMEYIDIAFGETSDNVIGTILHKTPHVVVVTDNGNYAII